MPAVLQAAHTRLMQLRRHIPDAGGLVIASDTKTARAYAKILQKLSSTPVAVVLSDEPGSSERISEFSESTDHWMVAVRMVSEGVDVPRLAVGVYATSAATPLFFAQAIGRFVRSRRKGETASVFLPSVPVLLNLAEHMEKQRDHVLGKPDRPKQGWEDDLLAEANREQNEPDDVGSYESLGADAELDSLIYDGSTYGTGTFSGSEEEADYLGLPGLLDADQVKALLRKRQEEQLDARDEQERLRREREAEAAKRKEIEAPPSAARRPPPPARTKPPVKRSRVCARNSTPSCPSWRASANARTGPSTPRHARPAAAHPPPYAAQSSCATGSPTSGTGDPASDARRRGVA